MNRGEWTALARAWWCRGCGAAVSVLLVAVSVFRHPRDGLFWIAAGFFTAHTALAARRYLQERRVRATATVTHTHRAETARPSRVRPLPPLPVASLVKTPPEL